MPSFFQKASKYHKRTTQNPRKIGKSLPEYVILQERTEFFFSIKIQKISISLTKKDLFLTEHTILLMCLRFACIKSLFQQNSSFSKLLLYYPEHLKVPTKNTPDNMSFTEEPPMAAFV